MNVEGLLVETCGDVDTDYIASPSPPAQRPSLFTTCNFGLSPSSVILLGDPHAIESSPSPILIVAKSHGCPIMNSHPAHSAHLFVSGRGASWVYLWTASP